MLQLNPARLKWKKENSAAPNRRKTDYRLISYQWADLHGQPPSNTYCHVGDLLIQTTLLKIPALIK